MSDRNNFSYKAMDWYDLLGFNRNCMSSSKLTREEYCSKYVEVAYQNCLSMLDQWTLAGINLFYKIPSLNYCAGKIENLVELRGKIQEAYDTLKNPEKRKEYEFEIFGIFCREYPQDELADEKFKNRAISFLKTDDEWDKELGHIYWKNYLTFNYWKNFQEEINAAKYKEEIKLYVRKFGELRMFILKLTNWGKKSKFDGQSPNVNVSEEIKQKEIELQNISEEEYWKEKNQPLRDGEWREMNNQEIAEMLGLKSPNYGWNFDKKQQDKPDSNNTPLVEENKNNVISLKKLHDLDQWMEKKGIEEIVLRDDGKVICKKWNENGEICFRTEIDVPSINLVFESFGKNSISRQELQEKLNIRNTGEEAKNDFDFTPWLFGGGTLVLVTVLFFVVRKKYKKSNYVK